MSRAAAPVALVAIAALAACTASEPRDSGHPLGMNDVTWLFPLPGLVSLAPRGDAPPLVTRGLVAGMALRGDLAPKSGAAFAIDDFHVVALRFDLCERAAIRPCADGEDGRLRLVLQPVFTDAAGALSTHDIALHAFYPLPAADLAAVVAELRDLARIAATPLDAPLGVTTALAVPGYADRLRTLVDRYARWDHLVRLTAFGQLARSAAFAWSFRGVDVAADGALAAIAIPEIGASEQTVLVAGGDTVYQTEPLADAPAGFALALNGMQFATAAPADQRASLAALVAIENPTLHDTVNAQCASCHVATFLTARRAAVAGVDLDGLPGRFTSPYNTRIDNLGQRDGRVLRALGYASELPVVSQRVANDTAQVLTEVDARFPP